MEKNVGSVDIEELKRARQALDQERGIESDPNMYSNYNPDRNNTENEQSSSESDFSENEINDENQEASSSEDEVFDASEPENNDDEAPSIDDIVSELEKEAEVSQSEEIQDSSSEETELSDSDSSAVSDDLQSTTEEQDFSAYDNFSAFEVNDNLSSSDDGEGLLADGEDETVIPNASDNLSEDDEIIIQDSLDKLNEEAKKINEEALDLLNEVTALDLDENDSVEDSTEDETEESKENVEETQLLNGGDVLIGDDSDFEDELDEESQPSEENTEETHESEESEEDDVELNLENDTAPAFETNELAGLQSHLIEENDISVQNEKATDDSSSDNELEIIDNYKKLGRLEDLLNEEVEEETEEEEEFEEEIAKYETIEDFNFVDVISTDEFKNSDRLSYVLGKNEKGEIIFGNLRDYYNMVIFGKQNDHIHDLVHSVLLSLIVKNSVNEVNFVMCDSKADSKFEIYNKSSYMYFNKLAKTNKEILDTLIEVTKELEERYNLLASVGVKSIEQYNTIAKNDGLKQLPYILTVFNNYSKSIQLSEADRINACLTQILKYGRIVGLYLIVVANTPIISEEINYNLPTRISFKADDKSRSFATLGYAGAEHLPQGGDFLCSTVDVDNIMHLKVASITRPEIEVLIENIEE